MANPSQCYGQDVGATLRNYRSYPKGREPNRQFAYSGIPGDSDIDT